MRLTELQWTVHSSSVAQSGPEPRKALLLPPPSLPQSAAAFLTSQHSPNARKGLMLREIVIRAAAPVTVSPPSLVQWPDRGRVRCWLAGPLR